MKLVARIEVNIRKEDVDSILFSAFNAGGISGPIRSGPAAESSVKGYASRSALAGGC